MAGSFFVLEVDSDRIRYWEVQRGRRGKIIRSGEFEDGNISISPSREVYVFFSPSLISTALPEVPKMKKRLFLLHLLSYKDKYFSSSSGPPLISYFITKEGRYYVFYVDRKLWDKVSSLLPNKKRVHGPYYWPFVPLSLGLSGQFRRDYKALSEVVSIEQGVLSLFKRGPKRQLDEFIMANKLDVVPLTMEDFILRFKKGFSKRLEPFSFREIRIKESNIGLYLAIIFIILIFLLFAGKTLREKKILEFEIQKLDTMIKKVKVQAEDIEKKKHKMEEMENIISSYNKVISTDTHVLDLLRSLSEILPKGTQIEYLEVEGPLIKDLEGRCENATKLLLAFQKSGFFSDMRFKGSVTKEDGKDRFAIEGRYIGNEAKTK